MRKGKALPFLFLIWKICSSAPERSRCRRGRVGLKTSFTGSLFLWDTKDYLLGKREAVFTLYRKRAEEKPALSSSRVIGDLALSSSADEEPDSALNRFFSFLEKRLHRYSALSNSR